jgi:hypothetical protein
VGVYTLTAMAAAYQPRSVAVAIAAGERVTHTFRLPSTPDLLIVDDDAGMTYESYILSALDTLAIPYATWTAATQGPVTSSTLKGYAGVLWFTGDDALNSLSRTEQIALDTYLDAGGRLFLTGQNIGMDIKNDYGAFFRNVLHASFVQDSAGVSETVGLSFYGGLTATLFGPGGADNQTSPDVIAPYDAAATPVFTYTTGAAGLAVDDGAHRLIYLAFGLEGVGDGATRAAILRGGLGGLGIAPPTARLDLTLTPQPARVWPEIPVTYTLTMLNDSQLPMTEGALTLTLPASVTVLSPTPATVILPPRLLAWRNLTLAPESAQTFTWTVVIPEDAGLSTFTSHVEAFWPRMTAPAELTATAAIAGPYALDLSPSVSRQTGRPGTTVTHPLILTNTGTLPMTATLTLSPGAWPAQIVPTRCGCRSAAARR